jgi:flagellar hook assembly protein FlgD
LDLGNKKAGSYKTHWDGKDNKGQTVASGVYFYVLKSKDGFTDIKKMVILR